MSDSEYYSRLRLVWGEPRQDDAYRDKLWNGWCGNFYPKENPKTYLKTWMDKNEEAKTNWWRPSWASSRP